VDLVVNNAGIGMRTVNQRFFDDPRPFFEVTPEGFTDVVTTNSTGYFLVARAFAAAFVEGRHGRFVKTSSMARLALRARSDWTFSGMQCRRWRGPFRASHRRTTCWECPAQDRASTRGSWALLGPVP
jgi:NAD(P)-dependent dehydrogenase (short-subunit alcohol dehydrogenase family)